MVPRGLGSFVAYGLAVAAGAAPAWAGMTERVSVGPHGEQADKLSYSPSISANGRFVAFASYATNLVPGDTNGVNDVFVRDRRRGTTERVSVGPHGGQANDASGSGSPSLSASGRYVAFESGTTNLVPGDTNGAYDVFVRDRKLGTTERVSVGPHGRQGNGNSESPSISADGRHVAFESAATNLIPGGTKAAPDVFVHDRGPSTGPGAP